MWTKSLCLYGLCVIQTVRIFLNWSRRHRCYCRCCGLFLSCLCFRSIFIAITNSYGNMRIWLLYLTHWSSFIMYCLWSVNYYEEEKKRMFRNVSMNIERIQFHCLHTENTCIHPNMRQNAILSTAMLPSVTCNAVRVLQTHLRKRFWKREINQINCIQTYCQS